MISLEELKRLYGETSVIPHTHDQHDKETALTAYLRNHCEEIIKILEERE